MIGGRFRLVGWLYVKVKRWSTTYPALLQQKKKYVEIKKMGWFRLSHQSIEMSLVPLWWRWCFYLDSVLVAAPFFNDGGLLSSLL